MRCSQPAEVYLWGESGKGKQMLKADKQQSVAFCVSSLRLDNKTEEMRGKEEEEMSGLLFIFLLAGTGTPSPHTSPPQERHIYHERLNWVLNISRGSRHLPDVGCVLRVCYTLCGCCNQQKRWGRKLWVEHRKLWEIRETTKLKLAKTRHECRPPPVWEAI